MTLRDPVAAHYARDGLEAVILEALGRSGKDHEHLDVRDTTPIDEFHIGGRSATEALAAQLPLRPGLRLVDLGCGLGGAARYLASEHDCTVTGIDLTPDYVEVARKLSDRLGLRERTRFECGSVLELPYEAASFDGAYTLHVAMNIENKAQFYAEAFRVVRPGGFFAVYDVMQGPAGPPLLPAPWAEDERTSFVLTPAEVRRLLEDAGFILRSETDRTAFGKEFFARVSARAAAEGPPELGIHLLMGPNFKAKITNMVKGVNEGRVAPTVMICERP